MCCSVFFRAAVFLAAVFSTTQVSFAQTCDDGCDSSAASRIGECFNGSNPGSLFKWRCQSADATLATLSDPLVTDRPDFTEASSVVGLGVMQLELGYTYTEDDATNTRSHSYPETLIRYGIVADWLELRVGWNYGSDDIGPLSSSGSDDLYLGFKIGLTPQDGWQPEMAIIPQMTVPSGSDNRTNDEVLAGLNWLYGWDINDFLAAGGSTQFNRALDEGTNGGYTEWAQSWTFVYALGDRLGAYTEYYGFFPSGADTASTEHYFNGGFSFLVNNDIQWDIRAGTGLNDAADDFLVGTGLSIRFH